MLVAKRPDQDVSFLVRSVGLVLVPVALWCVLLLAAPASLGTLVLGESWSVVRPILPWTSLEYCALALSAPAVIGLRGRAASGPYLKLRSTFAGLVVAFGVSAAFFLRDVSAVSGGLAVAALVYAIYAWLLLLRTPSTRAVR